MMAVVGLAVGALSFLAQGRLPGDWYYLGNSGAVWLVPAFFMGALVRSQRWAAVAGLGTLAGCLLGYFATGTLWDVPYSWVLIAYWVGVALVGGPVFGLAGRWWRDERQARRALALALLGGVFLAEGVYSLVFNPHLSVGWPLIAAGVLIPIIVGRSLRDRLWGLAALLPVAALGGAAFLVLLWINQAASGV
jgi:hypothetical protein